MKKGSLGAIVIADDTYLGTDLGRVWIKIPAGTKAGDTVEAKIPIEVNASTIAEVVEVKLVAGR